MSTQPDARVAKVRLVIETDDDADVSFLSDPQDKSDEDRAADAKRLDAYRRDEWWMTGIRLEAELIVASTIQTIATPGLWGVESDVDDAYLKQVAEEEYDALVEILGELGLTPPPFDTVRLDR